MPFLTGAAYQDSETNGMATSDDVQRIDFAISAEVTAVVQQDGLQIAAVDETVVLEVRSEADRSTTPSPPDTRPTTPRLTIPPCPVRFTPLIPPANYGSVVRDEVFRSGFPHARNIDFLEGLRLRSILYVNRVSNTRTCLTTPSTLVDGEPCEAYQRYIKEFGLEHRRIRVAANKDGKIQTTNDSLCEAIVFLLNPVHHPVYIHCNQGRHRTGCVVGCLRKVQQWPLDEILAEYHTYASPKSREADVALITAFDPASLVAYVAARQELRWWSRRLETVQDVFRLATFVLPPHNTAQLHSASSKLMDWYRSDSTQSTDSGSLRPSSVSSEASNPATFTNPDGVTVIDYALRSVSIRSAPPPPPAATAMSPDTDVDQLGEVDNITSISPRTKVDGLGNVSPRTKDDEFGFAPSMAVSPPPSPYTWPVSSVGA